jgi:hypothetical protein
MQRQTKITLGEVRGMGVRRLLVYCRDHRCSHSVIISAERWDDEVRLSDLEPRFVCQACGKRGAKLRAHFTDAPAPSRRP